MPKAPAKVVLDSDVEHVMVTHRLMAGPLIAGNAGGRIRTGFHLAGNADPITRVGLTVQQAMGVQVDHCGVLSMETRRTMTELLV